MRSLGEAKSDEQLEQMIAEVDVDGTFVKSCHENTRAYSLLSRYVRARMGY